MGDTQKLSYNLERYQALPCQVCGDGEGLRITGPQGTVAGRLECLKCHRGVSLDLLPGETWGELWPRLILEWNRRQQAEVTLEVPLSFIGRHQVLTDTSYLTKTTCRLKLRTDGMCGCKPLLPWQRVYLYTVTTLMALIWLMFSLLVFLAVQKGYSRWTLGLLVLPVLLAGVLVWARRKLVQQMRA